MVCHYIISAWSLSLLRNSGVFLGGGKKFIVFVVKALNVNILQTIEEIIDYLYLQYKQQPQK